MSEQRAEVSEENDLGEAGPSCTTKFVNQVFSMFKGYLSSQLEEKGKQLKTKVSIEKQATELKFK